MHFTYICCGILPIGLPILSKIIFQRGFGIIFNGGMVGCVFIAIILSFMAIFLAVFLAIKEKSCLPISYEFVGKYLVIYYKLRTYQILLKDCLYTDNFVDSLWGNYYVGTWNYGVTIYIRHDKLCHDFPHGNFDIMGRVRCYLPLNFIAKEEFCNYLESHGCHKFSLTWRKILMAFFAPSILLWGHCVVGWLFFDYIGFYGLYLCSVIGLTIGILFSIGLLTFPEPKNYHHLLAGMMFRIRLLLFASVIHIVITFDSPNFLAAIFCAILCFCDIYLLQLFMNKRLI
jgi:hypothetical protein